MEKKIDFVVTWVDGSDPKWILKKNKYTGKNDSSALYKDYDTLKYWFRMVEKNAEWVNKVFLITDNQIPKWINKNHEKLVLVNHSDYIPGRYLPTFNSNVIELNLFRIKGLSENFVLFNDDTFIINKIKKEDYFLKDKPVLYAIYNALSPSEPFIKTMYNNVEIISKYFKSKESFKNNVFKFLNPNYGMQLFRNILLIPWGITGYINMHLPSPIKKSTMKKLWELEFEKFNNSCLNKIRNYNEELNHYIFNYWQIEKGDFYPASVKFGKNVYIHEVKKLDKILNTKDIRILCVNDRENISDYYYEILRKKLQKKYDKKSKYEL